MAERVMVAVVLVVAVLGSRAPVLRAETPLSAQEKRPPQIVYEPVPESERLEIDGRKNPEMIPQWDIWLAAFEIISRASELPTEVLKQVSAEEASSIRDAAQENSRNFLALQQRVLQLMPTLQTDEAKFVTERTQALNIDFRWKVLQLRDRLLAGLNPAGQAALTNYVESLKAGIRVFVPKKELAYYRTPQ